MDSDADFVGRPGRDTTFTSTTPVTDGGGAAETRSYVTRDKIYLPSRTRNIRHARKRAGPPEGEQYPYYAGHCGRLTKSNTTWTHLRSP